jgi:Mrp family chromosome partitioning ATPase
MNSLFTGRKRISETIEAALRGDLNTDHKVQKRYVITGIGGVGKSELSLNIANNMRKEYEFLSHL